MSPTFRIQKALDGGLVELDQITVEAIAGSTSPSRRALLMSTDARRAQFWCVDVCHQYLEESGRRGRRTVVSLEVGMLVGM